MCGLLGYLGKGDARGVIREGLSFLEYRGYDSCGCLLVDGKKFLLHRRIGKGRIGEITDVLPRKSSHPVCAIGHTRWATHGENTVANAHPHRDCSGSVAVVHNGIIENHEELRRWLSQRGHRFRSGTDTEVIPHLIEEFSGSYQPEEAVRRALARLEGSFAVAIVFRGRCLMIVARKGSPLVVGVRGAEKFVASDPQALSRRVQQLLFLDDGEMAVLREDSLSLVNFITAEPVRRKFVKPSAGGVHGGKCGFDHFMLREIHQQPEVLARTITEALSTDAVRKAVEKFPAAGRVTILGCGTSWHAGLVGEYLIEGMAGIAVEVEYASEFRYKNPSLTRKDLVVAISQSGETADTLAAVREVKRAGGRVLAVCNVPGSSLARESDVSLFTHAGPEIGVASTKAFTTQLALLSLLALELARMRKVLPEERFRRSLKKLEVVPDIVQRFLSAPDETAALAARFFAGAHALFLGRGIQFPVALEGALKLKEVSYIHAEGYPAAEMKHGPLALIDRNMPVVGIVPRDATYGKVLGNLSEVRSRGGRILALSDGGDGELGRLADRVLLLPHVDERYMPIVSVVPLQLLAYRCAVLRGCDVDKPRNLAKSVTVE